MKLVIQRVKHASVTVDGNVTGKIGKGFLVLIGIANSDTKEIADQYLKKLLNLRIFEDENGKTNLSLKDVNGELLLVSQFTLYAVSYTHLGNQIGQENGERDDPFCAASFFGGCLYRQNRDR